MEPTNANGSESSLLTFLPEPPSSRSSVAGPRKPPPAPAGLAGLAGRKLRLRRLFDARSGNAVVVALDHGVTLGPISGIEDIRGAVGQIVGQGVNGIVLHKGNVRGCSDLLSTDPSLSVLLHVNASVTLSPHVNEKVMVATVEEGLRLGADAISIHVNIGEPNDHKMLADLGAVAARCDEHGVPLLAMMYCRGEGVDATAERNVALAARAAQELGADVAKVSYTGSVGSFRSVLRGVSIPVIIAGGAVRPTVRALLEDVSDAMEAGASGVAIGRNVFQQGRPRVVLGALNRLIHGKASIEDALRLSNAEAA